MGIGRLIDAERFIEYLGLDAENSREENLGEIVTLEDFDRQPTVDAELVRHGKWLDEKTGNPVQFNKKDGCPERSCKCSVCGEWLTASDEYPVTGNYCPNCGAKMDLEDKNG